MFRMSSDIRSRGYNLYVNKKDIFSTHDLMDPVKKGIDVTFYIPQYNERDWKNVVME